MNLLLRSMIFILQFYVEVHAGLCDFDLHFYIHLMLHSMTHLGELDSALCDLHLHA